ncbi:hypothetical protein OF83DRAFT_1058645 [Amylostereum chailletii]|nr:hypothetical protein OF83DRAFT_1058645 [Amylostereum chailletii]
MPVSKPSPLSLETFFPDDVTESSQAGSEYPSPISEKTTAFFSDNHVAGIHVGPDGEQVGVAAGRLPEEVYANTMSGWRNALRKKLVRCVEWESVVLAGWQGKVRRPWLDTYFVLTSTLGTHTFFMVFLPMFFYFGGDAAGRGLCYVLGLGIYASSFLKDLVCSPRPYAPPITRLTIGSHHLEYGFPSTHSTNSTSMALFLLSNAYTLLSAGTISNTTFQVVSAILLLYVLTIVGGRLYTGMHGFMDCTVGIVLGALMWLVQFSVMPVVERWLIGSGWIGPVTVLAVCLLMVNQHPQPVDDCPCFEDAIAIISVVMGILISFWVSKRVPSLDAALFTTVTPGHTLDTTGAWLTWTLFALLKLATGILAIFAWRILAKPTTQTVLPPLFRFLARLPVDLPNRRHYTPATEYAHGPPHHLRAIPSVIDLDMTLNMDDADGYASGTADKLRNGAVKRRGGQPEKTVEFREVKEDQLQDAIVVKHYDADVLTKVVVYAGIGVIATMLTPAAFEALEWGVGFPSPTF